MSTTFLTAALVFAAGYGLVIHGTISLVDNLNALAISRAAVALNSVEIAGGAAIFIGILGFTAGYFE
jgi:hypothetical protein